MNETERFRVHVARRRHRLPLERALTSVPAWLAAADDIARDDDPLDDKRAAAEAAMGAEDARIAMSVAARRALRAMGDAETSQVNIARKMFGLESWVRGKLR